MDKFLVYMEIILRNLKTRSKQFKVDFKSFKWRLYSFNENVCHNIFSKIEVGKTLIKTKKAKKKYRQRVLSASKRVAKYDHKVFSLSLEEFNTMITRDIINLAKQYTSLERPLIQDGKIIANDDYFLQMRTFVITTMITRYAAINTELDLLFYPNALETTIDLQYDLARVEILPNVVKFTMDAFTKSITLFE